MESLLKSIVIGAFVGVVGALLKHILLFIKLSKIGKLVW